MNNCQECSKDFSSDLFTRLFEQVFCSSCGLVLCKKCAYKHQEGLK